MSARASIVAACLAGGFASASVAAGAPVGTAFTYQGQLKSGGSPANGQFDLQFQLFFDPVNNASGSGVLTFDNVQVTNGLFTVALDFGPGIIQGDALWLEVGVRPGASAPPDPYTKLTPRQALTPAPYAIGLSLPYSALLSNSSALIGLSQLGAGPGVLVSQQGAGVGLRSDIINPANSAASLLGTTNGTGSAIYGANNGAGEGGHFEAKGGVGVFATTTSGYGVQAQATAGGTAVYGNNQGTAGNAGYFRNAHGANSSPALRVESNGGNAGDFHMPNVNSSGAAINASTAGLGRAGSFANTNPNNPTEPLAARTNGSGNTLASTNTGTGSAGVFEVSNAANNSPALEAKTNGTGLAGKFDGDAHVTGVIYRNYNNTLRRATPIAYGRIGENGQGNVTVIGSANVTVSFDVNTKAYTITVIGESNPETWTVQANLVYSNPADPDFTMAMRVGIPDANGKFKIWEECDSGCGGFTSDYVETDFVVYRP